jgi:hypothetical protein
MTTVSSNFFVQSALTVKDFASHACSCTQKSIQASGPFINEALKASASKIQELWTFLHPYIKVIATFLQTKLGTSILCFSSALPFFCLARKSENKRLALSYVALGILGTLSGTYMLMASGALPLPSTLKLAVL